MTTTTCSHHPNTAATWQCINCGKLFCVNCITETSAKQQPAGTCTDCGARLASIVLREEKAAQQEAQKIDRKVTIPREKGVKHRDPALVVVFSVLTAGIYGIYWLVCTTNELRRLTDDEAPSPWALLFLLIPGVDIIVALLYFWSYSLAIKKISGFNYIVLSILWYLLSPAAMVIAQIQLNKKAEAIKATRLATLSETEYP